MAKHLTRDNDGTVWSVGIRKTEPLQITPFAATTTFVLEAGCAAEPVVRIHLTRDERDDFVELVNNIHMRTPNRGHHVRFSHRGSVTAYRDSTSNNLLLTLTSEVPEDKSAQLLVKPDEIGGFLDSLMP